MNQLALVEGNRDIRDKFIDKTEVLDKVKEIIMLPDGKHIESRHVADYYDVDMVTLRSVRNRHRSELDEDGVLTLVGEDFKNYRDKISLHGATLLAKATITLFTRRAMLRIGMLLKESQVAQKVRDYLLDTEEEVKEKFVGSWTDEERDIIRETIIEFINDGKTLTDAYSEAAERMNHTHTVSAISQRYQLKIKKTMPTSILEKIKENMNLFNARDRQKTVPTIEQKSENVHPEPSSLMLSEYKQILESHVELHKRINELEYEMKLKDMLVKDQDKVIMKLQEDIRELVTSKTQLEKFIHDESAAPTKRFAEILKMARKIVETAKIKDDIPNEEIKNGRAYVIRNGVPEFF